MAVFFWLVILAFGAMTLLWIVVLFKSGLVTPLRGILAVAGAIVILIFLAIPSMVSKREVSYAPSSSVSETVTDTAAGRSLGYVAKGKVAEPSYQGLPARFTIPNGARSSYFSQELLRIDRPQNAFTLVISSTLVKWLGALIALVAIFLLWRQRTAITTGIRARIASAEIAPEPAPAG